MITPFGITCVILSGGKSSRMEKDKSLLPFASKTLIQYQYERLKPYFKDVYISSKVDKFDFLDKKYLIIDENKEVFSPILALDTIFKIFQNQKIFIITVDSPFVSIQTISKLIYESKDYDICIAQTEKTHNLCGIFSSNISLSIKTMISNNIHKIFYLIKNNNYKIIQFQNNSEFININNKNDYEEALNNII
jgi:molybdenum cofactor guanylyltransferase